MKTKLRKLPPLEYPLAIKERPDPDASKIVVCKGYISLRFKPAWYEIELERIPDAAALIGWIYHLCGKGWMNPWRLALFIEAAEKATGIKINYHA